MTRDDLENAWNASTNLRAFCMAIRHGEGTMGLNGYRTMFGGGLFESFADHPRTAVSKKLRKGGILVSTAAGAYQYLERTWDGVAKQYGFKDFSPHNQDLGCVALIAGRGALADVMAGRFEEAVKKCNREWASLPESPYGQPTVTMDEFMAVLNTALAHEHVLLAQEKSKQTIEVRVTADVEEARGKIQGLIDQAKEIPPMPGKLDLVRAGLVALKPGGLRDKGNLVILITTAFAAAVHFGAKYGWYDLSWVDRDTVVELAGGLATLIILYTRRGAPAAESERPADGGLVQADGGGDRNTEDTMRAGG